MNEYDLVESILLWAEDHPEFNTAFVENIREQLEIRGSLSRTQIEALENIKEKWGIE